LQFGSQQSLEEEEGEKLISLLFTKILFIKFIKYNLLFKACAISSFSSFIKLFDTIKPFKFSKLKCSFEYFFDVNNFSPPKSFKNSPDSVFLYLNSSNIINNLFSIS
jgi:hypothetical protein